jgi:hypothetical protein
MKAFKAAILVLVILGSLGYSARILFIGPCDSPRGYRIGFVDSRFGVSEPELILALREAETLWEEAVGKDLFVFDSKARMPINLVYDERQATSQRNRVLESDIAETGESADAIKREFEALKRRHEAAQMEYESMRASFEAEQKAYNEKIAYWNGRGGAPRNEYQKLESDKSRLESSYAALESKRKEVNGLVAEINAKIAKYNFLVREVNAAVDIINESADKEFEQGEFRRENGDERVEIYAFTDRGDLVRVLAHEFGHVLDSDHNSNQESIMYYLNTSENMEPTTEDVAGVKESCKFKE